MEGPSEYVVLEVRHMDTDVIMQLKVRTEVLVRALAGVGYTLTYTGKGARDEQ